MRAAAYQAPLFPSESMAALDLIRERVAWCAAQNVRVLLCPEAILGGLADDARNPLDFAVRVDDGELGRLLAPLSSERVTTVIGFTEVAGDAQFYNAAAVFSQGRVAGIYRKRHPARRSSVYQPGTDSPVFQIDGLSFGIMICNDTNFPDLSADLVARGANMLFVPSNNGLRPQIADVVAQTREVDIECARRLNVPVIRADVAGDLGERRAFGSSAIINAQGHTLHEGRPFEAHLLMADLDI